MLIRIFALFWCILGVSHAGDAQGSQSGLMGSQISYSDTPLFDQEDPRREREHWLRSRLKFSGKTTRDTEGADGNLGVSLDDLIWSNHSAGINFSDTTSRRDKNDRQSLSFRYSFPAGRSRVSVDFQNAQYTYAARSDDTRFIAGGEVRTLGVTGQRPLASVYGFNMGTVFRHTSRDKRNLKQGSLVSEHSYQLSTFALRGRRHFDLLGDISARSQIEALGGYEYEGAEYPTDTANHSDDNFHKVSVSASLSRKIRRWNLGVDGHYQRGSEGLPTSEYLQVAGSGILSGFNGQSLHVVEGGWVRLDTRSPSFSVPFTNNLLSSLELSVVKGWAPYSSLQQDRHGQTSAGQLSLHLNGRHFVADMSVGRVLEANTDRITVPGGPDLSFSVSMDI